jgi:hypothetical protein
LSLHDAAKAAAAAATAEKATAAVEGDYTQVHACHCLDRCLFTVTVSKRLALLDKRNEGGVPVSQGLLQQSCWVWLLLILAASAASGSEQQDQCLQQELESFNVQSCVTFA